MRVDWLRRASRELDDQLDFLAARNPNAALDAVIAIDAAILTIGGHPMIGRIGRLKPTREYVITGTPFLLVYRVESGGIVIIRFLHTSQNYP